MLFKAVFKRPPGQSADVAASDLQDDVATTSSQVTQQITVPAGLSGKQLAVAVFAPEELVSVSESSLVFEKLIDNEAADDGAGTVRYGSLYNLGDPADGLHTITFEFEGDCTPDTVLVVVQGAKPDSAVGYAQPLIGVDVSQLTVTPPTAYTLALDFISADDSATFTPRHNQSSVASDTKTAASSKPDLNTGIDQAVSWTLAADATVAVHMAVVYQPLTGPDPIPPGGISTVAQWLFDGDATDEQGEADGTIFGMMETGVDDLADNSETCLAADGATGYITAPNIPPVLDGEVITDPKHQPVDATKDLYVQADDEVPMGGRECWLCKITSQAGNREAGQFALERVNPTGSQSRGRFQIRNAATTPIFVETGASPDAEHGIFDWDADVAYHIQIVIDTLHGSENVRVYVDGTKIATAAISFTGLALNTQPWTWFAYRNNASTFVNFAKGMIYRTTFRDAAISDATAASEDTALPAVSITHNPGAVADFDAEVDAYSANLVSYWKFENNGADREGVSNAVIFGGVELNVETIVDLDRIAEGAPVDGKVIAFPGLASIYAEAPHASALKTAAGTIVVHFQRDTSSVKSTLVAGDRSIGGTSAGAGGFSIEVEADGSPRAFLRQQSDGAAVVITGNAGDVAVNAAYAMVFKWGTGGLSLALYNAAGSLVRRATDALTDGLTGTSPIRFGLWHDGTSSPHDGPYGRVIWLDRRISDGEETDLARGRTISRSVPPGEYTPFPFATAVVSPDHTGVTERPGYSPTDPRSASIIDPMSGLELFRVGGDNGENLYINGTQDSGLDFPKYCRTENTSNAMNCWNADSTLMMVGRRFTSGGDPGGATVSSYLIDASGTHGASTPWRILRADVDTGLGDGVGNVWFWDPLNPLRAIAIEGNGTVNEWWPIGGAGHSTGEINQILQVPGVDNAGSAHRTALHASYDGRYYIMPCRRISDGALGGVRIDLIAETYGPFRQTPLQSNNDTARCAVATSPRGKYTYFNTNLGGSYDRYQIMDWDTGQVTAIVPDSNSFAHIGMVIIDGEEYTVGGKSETTGWRMMRNSGPVNQTDGDLIQKTTGAFLGGANPQHSTGKNYKDLMETYGGVGGSSSGNRYAIWCRSNGSNRGIYGIRLGVNDLNQIRLICNHRSERYSNRSEVHPMPSPDMSYMAFSSNWEYPGVVTGDVVNPYVCVIPDAWYSPNNDGS